MVREKEQKEERKSRIDPDVSHYSEHNLDATRRLGWRYVSRHAGLYGEPAYVDSDGELIADRFGQSLG